MNEKGAKIPIAKILKPHGIKGSLRVKSFAEDRERFFTYPFFEVDIPDSLSKAKVKIDENTESPLELILHLDDVKGLGQMLVLSFKEIDSIEVAEKYRNAFLTVNRAAVIEQPSFNSDDILINDLVGFRVVDMLGDSLGVVEGYYEGGNHGLYLVKQDNPSGTKNQDFYLPCERSFYKDIDWAKQTIVVDSEDFLI